MPFPASHPFIRPPFHMLGGIGEKRLFRVEFFVSLRVFHFGEKSIGNKLALSGFEAEDR